MPTICIFYGIIIRMFFDEHAPPHFHAQYGEFLWFYPCFLWLIGYWNWCFLHIGCDSLLYAFSG